MMQSMFNKDSSSSSSSSDKTISKTGSMYKIANTMSSFNPMNSVSMSNMTSFFKRDNGSGRSLNSIDSPIVNPISFPTLFNVSINKDVNQYSLYIYIVKYLIIGSI